MALGLSSPEAMQAVMLDLLYDSDDGSRVMTPCAAVVPEAPSDFVQNPAHAGGLSDKDTVGERAQKQDYTASRAKASLDA